MSANKFRYIELFTKAMFIIIGIQLIAVQFCLFYFDAPSLYGKFGKFESTTLTIFLGLVITQLIVVVEYGLSSVFPRLKLVPLFFMTKKNRRDALLGLLYYKGDYLKYIKKQDEELCINAVRHVEALQYVKQQTNMICQFALAYNWQSLKYVKDQDPETCLLITRSHLGAYNLIHDPETKLYVKLSLGI